MTGLMGPQELALARHFKQLYSRYQRGRDLISVGAYVPGSDQLLDQAIDLHAGQSTFLQQDMAERDSHTASLQKLSALFNK
jgi:flagellum-specific ATP synthase